MLHILPQHRMLLHRLPTFPRHLMLRLLQWHRLPTLPNQHRTLLRLLRHRHLCSHHTQHLHRLLQVSSMVRWDHIRCLCLYHTRDLDRIHARNSLNNTRDLDRIHAKNSLNKDNSPSSQIKDNDKKVAVINRTLHHINAAEMKDWFKVIPTNKINAIPAITIFSILASMDIIRMANGFPMIATQRIRMKPLMTVFCRQLLIPQLRKVLVTSISRRTKS